MTFVKNKFSYALWACYIAIICFCYFGLMVSGLISLSITDKSALICICCLPLFFAAGLFALIRWCIGRLSEAGRLPIRISPKLEIVTVLFLIVTGIVIRIVCIGNGAEEAAYFATAQVNGQKIPMTAQRVQYLYLWLLRGLFYVTGNHFSAGLVLQIILQMLATAIWYLALRKMIGKAGAFIFLLSVTLLPYYVEAGLTYSPVILYWLLYGIAFFMITILYEKEKSSAYLKWQNGLILLGIGVFIGCLSYLDAFGMTLLAFFVFINLLKKDTPVRLNENGEKESPVLRIIILLAGYFCGKYSLMFLDALFSNTNIEVIMSVWTKLFFPKGSPSLDAVLGSFSGPELFRLVLVFFFLILGAPSFCLRKDAENQLIWIIYTGIAAAFCLLRVETDAMHYNYLMFSALIILMAAGLQELLYIPEKTAEVFATSEKAQTEPEKTPEPSEERYKQPADGGKKIDYIENPLPLPKKSEKKSMGYRYEISTEQMHYDIQVPDSDDFDLKDV